MQLPERFHRQFIATCFFMLNLTVVLRNVCLTLMVHDPSIIIVSNIVWLRKTAREKNTSFQQIPQNFACSSATRNEELELKSKKSCDIKDRRKKIDLTNSCQTLVPLSMSNISSVGQTTTEGMSLWSLINRWRDGEEYQPDCVGLSVHCFKSLHGFIISFHNPWLTALLARFGSS